MVFKRVIILHLFLICCLTKAEITVENIIKAPRTWYMELVSNSTRYGVTYEIEYCRYSDYGICGSWTYNTTAQIGNEGQTIKCIGDLKYQGSQGNQIFLYETLNNDFPNWAGVSCRSLIGSKLLVSCTNGNLAVNVDPEIVVVPFHEICEPECPSNQYCKLGVCDFYPFTCASHSETQKCCGISPKICCASTEPYCYDIAISGESYCFTVAASPPTPSSSDSGVYFPIAPVISIVAGIIIIIICIAACIIRRRMAAAASTTAFVPLVTNNYEGSQVELETSTTVTVDPYANVQYAPPVVQYTAPVAQHAPVDYKTPVVVTAVDINAAPDPYAM